MGIILYQFLIGDVPFAGTTEKEVFAHVLSGTLKELEPLSMLRWNQFANALVMCYALL